MYDVISYSTGKLYFRGPFRKALDWAYDYCFRHNRFFSINRAFKIITILEA